MSTTKLPWTKPAPPTCSKWDVQAFLELLSDRGLLDLPTYRVWKAWILYVIGDMRSHYEHPGNFAPDHPKVLYYKEIWDAMDRAGTDVEMVCAIEKLYERICEE